MGFFGKKKKNNNDEDENKDELLELDDEDYIVPKNYNLSFKEKEKKKQNLLDDSFKLDDEDLIKSKINLNDNDKDEEKDIDDISLKSEEKENKVVEKENLFEVDKSDIKNSQPIVRGTVNVNDNYWDSNDPFVKGLLTVLFVIGIVGVITYFVMWFIN